MNAIQKRPTETVSGLALAVAIYGFLTQAAVGTELAAVVAVVLAFLPAAVSGVVDRLFVRRGTPFEDAAGEE